MKAFTVFYDGCCPLCVAEMRTLAALDTAFQIEFVNLQAPDFQEKWPQIDAKSADRILMGVTIDGEVLRGLDATHKVWSLVGKGYRTAWLRWPLIKPCADVVYRVFAKHRYKISAWITGQSRCESCSIEPLRSSKD
jgi:predicted DCC family thiol-disulfide oxidoreductase YuxK